MDHLSKSILFCKWSARFLHCSIEMFSQSFLIDSCRKPFTRQLSFYYTHIIFSVGFRFELCLGSNITHNEVCHSFVNLAEWGGALSCWKRYVRFTEENSLLMAGSSPFSRISMYSFVLICLSNRINSLVFFFFFLLSFLLFFHSSSLSSPFSSLFWNFFFFFIIINILFSVICFYCSFFLSFFLFFFC